MKREVRVTLSQKDVAELVVDVVAKKQKLETGYTCAVAMVADGELVCCYAWPPKGES